ncbi:polysaccharide pyruvyl transferase family protein [Tenacibaculum finnmarkense]|uniref:polysaccharide pyruvyl transferase family protein n=1 Tax=Tenacibaculum finnmarkense TaxID=2781243 RepID=UPI001E6582A8|nr:polysaccharide pyruvyl transferase family protein [Tenacibaculum finnmarkense]MCD8400503.1 polysaccharide pyruvyl transferase family protein [Tenacibaculum finnmarkense genomovar ulcerans]
MKIGIMTQPLHSNYGGILQNYGLQQVLKKIGHEPYTIRREKIINTSLLTKIKLVVSFFKLYKFRYVKSEKEFLIERQNAQKFVSKYINSTALCYDSKSLEALQLKHEFEAYVVGSDQVWRPQYSPNILNYFLDFLDNTSFKSIIKISYAASFGVDTWLFSEKDTLICKKLAQSFKGISVREKSGIALCENYLDSDATLVLDPTLLVEKQEYESLIESYEKESVIAPIKGDFFFVYILDKTKEKLTLIDEISEKTNKKPIFISHVSTEESPVVPPIEEWLKRYRDCSFIMTDSFHGTAFSILFNKPFVSFGNKNRGLSRFNSILTLFDLKDRLLVNNNFSTATVLKLLQQPLDTKKVNTKLNEYRELSLNFLKNNLKK